MLAYSTALRLLLPSNLHHHPKKYQQSGKFEMHCDCTDIKLWSVNRSWPKLFYCTKHGTVWVKKWMQLCYRMHCVSIARHSASLRTFFSSVKCIYRITNQIITVCNCTSILWLSRVFIRLLHFVVLYHTLLYNTV